MALKPLFTIFIIFNFLIFFINSVNCEDCQYDNDCPANSWCSHFFNMSICICDLFYKEVNGKCEMDNFCGGKDVCLESHSVCKNGVCVCESGFEKTGSGVFLFCEKQNRNLKPLLIVMPGVVIFAVILAISWKVDQVRSRVKKRKREEREEAYRREMEEFGRNLAPVNSVTVEMANDSIRQNTDFSNTNNAIENSENTYSMELNETDVDMPPSYSNLESTSPPTYAEIKNKF